MYICIRECFVNGRRYVPNNLKKNIGEFPGVDKHPYFKEIANVPVIPVIDDSAALSEFTPPLPFQKKVTPEIQQEMKELKEGGMTVKDIAQKFDVSVSTVMKYTKEE
jgi:DNA-binding NarL/FixJ family response regulator